MKISCGVIRDLLPLYVEGMDSKETHILIEEHISDCESCKKELEEMRLPSTLPVNNDVVPLKRIKATLQKKKMLTIILSVVLTLTVVMIGVGYAFAPQFISYTEGMVQFSENDNGVVLANFTGTVAGYEISSYYSKEHGGRVYSISAWDNAWNKIIGKNSAKNITVNSNGEPITNIYYSANNDEIDTLLYGESLFENGGSVTIPYGTLSHFALLAIIMAVVLGFAIFISRKHPKISKILLKVAYLPLAYLLAHFFVKGFHAASYAVIHDLFTILLLTVPLYALALLLEALYSKKVMSKENF